MEDHDITVDKTEARRAALREWENATNVAILVFADDHPDVRRILLQARGDVREALGEGRS